MLSKEIHDFLPKFFSTIFGACICPTDTCIESAEIEELEALKSEIKIYKSMLGVGWRKTKKKANELDLFPIPFWAHDIYKNLWANAEAIEGAAQARIYRNKLESSRKPSKQKKIKAQLHALHQEKLKRFDFAKRQAFYDLVKNHIGDDLFNFFMEQARLTASATQSADAADGV